MKTAMQIPFMLFALTAGALAQDVVFTVGGDKAAGKAAAAGGKWAKNPTKAFKQAAKAIDKGGEMTVVMKIAAGDYKGDLGSGVYILPGFKNPKATLRIEGGYSADFAGRDPFGTPTRFVTHEDRSAPLIKFRISTPSKQDELAGLVIDGIVMDVTNSNRYDKKTESLLKGSSSSHVVINFGYLRTDLLDIRNCVVLNTPHRAFETLIRAASNDAVVRLYNNVFLNCVIPVKVDTARYRHKAAKIIVDHNSFLLNWAYNPDPNTSNPAALELGPKDACKEMVITNNLFYANFGGAILALHKLLPELTVNDNNFVGNGMLHGQTGADAVAMIVEAGGKKQELDVATIEDVDAVEEAEGNVSIAPGIPLALAKVQVVDASEVEVDDSWENQARSILGLNLRGGKVDIRGYAFRKEYDPKSPPFPTIDAAKAYGASSALVKPGS